MTGGVIRIRGNAGARAGDRMRRGLIAIEGDAGAQLASRMVGGTIVCFGRAGELPGYLMTRGTVVLGKGGGVDRRRPSSTPACTSWWRCASSPAG